MLHRPDEITRDQLIEYVAERGLRLTAHQLVRWHRYGLLPRPRRVALGRGKGTVSVYPMTAAPQALALAVARFAYRDLDRMAWSIWLDGYPVTARVREALIGTLDEAVKSFRALLSALTADEDIADDPTVDLLETSPRGFARVRKSARPTVYRVLLEVLLGEFQEKTVYDAHDWEIIAPAIIPRSLSRTTTDSEVSKVLVHSSRLLSLPSARRAISTMSDRELESTRADILRVWRFLEAELRIPLPTPSPQVFVQFLMLIRGTPETARWWRWLRRSARSLGYATFDEALSNYRGARTT